MKEKHKKKNPPGKPREEIVRAVTEKAEQGRLTCDAAHGIVERLNVPPAEVGDAADVLGVKIEKCQLGLFGYAPEKKKVGPAVQVSPGLQRAIETSVVNGRISCADAWRVAEELHLTRMEVSSACEAMRIKISSCQLGAF
jgi:hypothetical protein